MRSALKKSWLLKMGPTGCPETSVRNCRYTLRNIPKNAYLFYFAEEAWNHGLCQSSTRRSHPPPSKSLPITLYQSSYHSLRYMLTVPQRQIGQFEYTGGKWVAKVPFTCGFWRPDVFFLILHENKSEFSAFCTWGHIGTVCVSAWTAESVGVLHY